MTQKATTQPLGFNGEGDNVMHNYLSLATEQHSKMQQQQKPATCNQQPLPPAPASQKRPTLKTWKREAATGTGSLT